MPEQSRSNNRWIWLVWLLGTALFAGYLGYKMVWAEQQSLFLIGDLTHGHHQIEMACTTCHTDPFGGKEVIQEACVSCHAAELKAVEDSHPKSKFTDPRNAARTAIMDARYCVTCHMEHNTDNTHTMGVTVPQDFCFHCHQDIAEERPTHQGMPFDSCASAGCHNFHDNKALYENFLVKHGHDPLHLEQPQVHLLSSNVTLEQKLKALNFSLADAPAAKRRDDLIGVHWEASLHAQVGVNCSDCHQGSSQSAANWLEKPDHQVCAECHQSQTDGFLAGKHGMRLAAQLPPMQVADALLPMHKGASHKTLSCNSCHDAHSVDIQQAAVESCLGCHADQHSQNYKQSKHYQLWREELNGQRYEGTGVSCATCHMPRTVHREQGREVVHVEHNQNATLRPNEKMLRPVCMQCHGLGFALDALADPALIEMNFSGQPSLHIESIDMALEREHAQ